MICKFKSDKILKRCSGGCVHWQPTCCLMVDVLICPNAPWWVLLSKLVLWMRCWINNYRSALPIVIGFRLLYPDSLKQWQQCSGQTEAFWHPITEKLNSFLTHRRISLFLPTWNMETSCTQKCNFSPGVRKMNH